MTPERSSATVVAQTSLSLTLRPLIVIESWTFATLKTRGPAVAVAGSRVNWT